MNQKNKIYDVAIIGAGVVGYAGGVYSGRLELDTVIIGEEPGGTITKTDLVENYPGFQKITGVELAETLKDHAAQYVKDFIYARAETIVKKGTTFEVTVEGKTIHAKTILFATGAEWKKIGVPGEKEYANKGVHYCAVCDGPLYKGKRIAVIGGGDSAIKESVFLAKYAKEVIVIARSELRPEPINLARMRAEPKISVRTNTATKKIIGEKYVTGLVIEPKGKKEETIPVDAVFVMIGHVPRSDLLKPLGVQLNAHGEIIIDKESKTNVSGVFAAGDVTDTRFKQAITGVGEAVKAIYSINEYLKKDGMEL